MFTLREANLESDGEAAERLLKKVFGDTFTSEYFRWKHMENPAGKSCGLVAVQDSEIIGLCLFMRWQLLSEEGLKNCLRPVDAAVDPAFRGNGLFATLTKESLRHYASQDHGVFCTPNANSLPTFMKLGWQQLPAALLYYVNFVLPVFGKKAYKSVVLKDAEQENDLSLGTSCKSNAFLRWRYQDPSYKKTLALVDGIPNLLIYKTIQKVMGGVRMQLLLVEEFIGDNSLISRVVQAVCYREGVFCYYFGDFGNTSGLKNFTSLKRGASIVACMADNGFSFSPANFSTGDLEAVV